MPSNYFLDSFFEEFFLQPNLLCKFFLLLVQYEIPLLLCYFLKFYSLPLSFFSLPLKFELAQSFSLSLAFQLLLQFSLYLSSSVSQYLALSFFFLSLLLTTSFLFLSLLLTTSIFFLLSQLFLLFQLLFLLF